MSAAGRVPESGHTRPRHRRQVNCGNARSRKLVCLIAREAPSPQGRLNRLPSRFRPESADEGGPRRALNRPDGVLTWRSGAGTEDLFLPRFSTGRRAGQRATMLPGAA